MGELVTAQRSEFLRALFDVAFGPDVGLVVLVGSYSAGDFQEVAYELRRFVAAPGHPGGGHGWPAELGVVDAGHGVAVGDAGGHESDTCAGRHEQED